MKGFLAALAVAGALVLYVFEFRFFHLTLHGSRLALIFALLGAVLGAVPAYRFSRKSTELLEQFQLYLFFILLGAIFMPLFGSLSNRLLSGQAPRPVPVELAEVAGRYVEPYGVIEGKKPEANQFFIFFYHRNHLYRIRSSRPLFADRERGDTISLTLQRGLWGFEVVKNIP